ncbi:MAG: HAD family hydrolase [Promethearchaeota archaeon]
MSTKKWIIFDAMGVIFEEGHDLHELLLPYVQQMNPSISVDTVKDSYIKASLGEISSKEFWISVGLGDKYPEIEKSYLDNCLKMDPEFIPVARELKKEYTLALLSNDVKEWSQYLRKRHRIDDLFSVILISGDVGIRKPDMRIFKLFLEKINVAPENCVFVDDNLYNLEPASKLRMKTMRFIRNEKKTPFCSEFEITSFNELQSVLRNFQ